MPDGLHRDGDRGSIVLGWLTRLTLTIALLGIIGFEVLSIVVVKVQVQDIGQSAALDALDSYKESSNAEAAYQAASAYAESQGAQIKKKSFAVTDKSVTFELQKVAPTLFLYRWDKTASYAEVSTTIFAEPIEAGGQLP